MLIDQHGRRIRKLRLSLTDKCNLRCHYCMPVDQTFMEEEKYLSVPEMKLIIEDLVDLGLEEVRVTGGEPLVRSSFADVIRMLKGFPQLKAALTTNGILLDRYLDLLLEEKVFHLNVSLDSLKPDVFRLISRGDHYQRVMRNILRAHEMGFVVKINTVIMKGVNDLELLDFVNFAATTGIEVRFLEIMRIGHARGEQEGQFISASQMLSLIKEHHSLVPVTKEHDSTSFNFITNTGANIGFIASESQAFCGACSRWRLSADGILRACLLKDDGLSIKNLSAPERLSVYYQLLGMKPQMRPAQVSHSMNLIGG
jgi:GTP 3',8-cyclase